MNSVRQESFNLVNGGRVQNLVPLAGKLEYLSRYKPFAAFSDFLWMDFAQLSGRRSAVRAI